MKTPLSKIFLDDYPIELMGDEARPQLSRIVRAGGKVPGRVDIIWLQARSDPNGAAVDPDEFIDRTSDPTRPIYLRSLPRLPMPGEGTVTRGAADAIQAPKATPARPDIPSKSTGKKMREIAPSGPVTSHAYVRGPGANAPTPDPVIAQLGKPPITDADIAAARAVPVVTRRPKTKESLRKDADQDGDELRDEAGDGSETDR